MALFPKDEVISGSVPNDAPHRMRWTREQGTRKLLTLLEIVIAAWWVAGKIQDHFLLAQKWDPLKPMPEGLTVVGALNPRGNYDRNLFKIFTENATPRVALTEYGWNSIFDTRNGSLCSDTEAQTIDHAIHVDSLAGYAMLEPYLRALVAQQMGDRKAFAGLSRATPVYVPAESKTIAARQTTLGELLDRFSGHEASDTGEESDTESGGGSNSGRSVEQVIFLPADTVADTLPVVLTGVQFTDAWLEEQPANLITPQAYTVHLGLTPEGRSRFFQWSHDHENESLVFILNHSIMAGPRVSQTLDVNEWEVTNITDKQAAEALVKYVSRGQGSEDRGQ